VGTELFVVVCGQHPPPPSIHVTFLWGTIKQKVHDSNPYIHLMNLRKISEGKFYLFPKKSFSVWMWTFYGGVRNVCGTTESIYSTCCNMCWL